ncbi:beta-lactamase/transpeptidase-like protein [Polyplosphaeria fusca]|uniref:Beta-lactamase/transpeptidase-like protein n=1 Tax=Polyplosphaeria fusca TaxID=682080 RepID=A0A9P4QU35_9PLEO|nr:beta-lactamase/transpeptidase-like protein [Polyplosphaeria fusca]
MASFGTKVDTYTEGESPDVLGAIFLAVDKNGKKTVSHATGRSGLDTDTGPLTEDSVLRLASCTKLLTTLTALRLVQSNTLTLDDPSIIEQHLPELCSQPVFTSEAGQPLTYEDQKSRPTLRMLLTHSSGVGYDMIDPRLQSWRKERGEKQLTLVGPASEAFGVPLLFQPGKGWAYGGGLDLAGLLIERVTGRSLGEVLRTEVCDIVGCDARIGFSETHLGGSEPVQVVTKQGAGFKKWPVTRTKHELGGGAAFSSPANYTRILQDLVSPTPKLLGDDMLRQLFAPQFADSSEALSALRDSAPVFASMTGALTGGLSADAFNHALGGLLITRGDKAGTMAWGGAFNSIWFANRERGVAGFFGASMFPFANREAGEMFGVFVEEVWGGMGEV